MGAPSVQRVRHRGRPTFWGSFALLAALIFSLQGDYLTSLTDRVLTILEQVLPQAGEELPQVLDELTRIEGELQELLPTLPDKQARSAHLALYRIATMRYSALPEVEVSIRLRWASQAVDHARESRKAEAICRAALFKARLRINEGFVREGRNTLEWAVEGTRGHAKRTWAWVAYALGEAELQLGHASAALSQLEAVDAALAEERAPGKEIVDHEVLRARLIGTRGQLHLNMGLLDRAALSILAEGDAVAKLEPNRYQEREAWLAYHLHKANLELLRGRYMRVVELIDDWLADAALYPLGSRERTTRLIVLGQALALLSVEDPAHAEQAIPILQEALAADLSKNDRVGGSAWLSMSLRRLGNLDEAERAVAAGRAVLETAREEGRPRPLAEPNLAAEAVRLALARSDPAESLVELREWLRDAIRTWLGNERSLPLRSGGLGFLQHSVRRSWFGELARVEVASREQAGCEAALEELLAMQATGSLARSLGLGPGTLADVRQELLGAKHGILIYVPALERSHAIVVTRTEAEYVPLASDRKLYSLQAEHTNAVRQYLRALRVGTGTNELGKEERRAAARLSAQLFPAPIAQRIRGWRSLTVVGAELFDSTSFDLLPVGDAEALGLACAVDYVPALPLGLLLAQRAGEATDAIDLDAVFLAGARPHDTVSERWGEVGEFTLSKRQQNALVGAYDSKRTEVLVGAQVTRGALSGDLPGRSRLLQLLVHSVQDTQRERPALLVLSPEDENDEGLVSCDDVEALSAPRMVLLTACSTGRGPVRKGDEGTGHMGGAFLAAGAQVVIQSDRELWLDEALALSEVLHRRLREHGDSPAEALRRARVELLEDGLFQHVAETDALRAFGLGHRPLFEASK
jgi:hypothetical protein